MQHAIATHGSATGAPADRWYQSDRLGGLRRFAVAITILNILGHTWFGFEQSIAQPLVALAAAYGMELMVESIDCWLRRRRPRFAGGPGALVHFLMPAHISGLACGMLLYANDRLAPIAFAAAVAIGSKHLIRLRFGQGTRHVFNPSNLGIVATLLLFPWVGIAPPYHFTENLTGAGDWILPAIIICSGSFLNVRFTRRWPLLAAWLGGFVLQAAVRSLATGAPFTACLAPMTGVAFLLYTFYMITDPPTTPSSTRGQVLFGASVAATYGLLMTAHIVFGLFFALAIVASVRFAGLLAGGLVASRQERLPASAPAPASVEGSTAGAMSTPAPASVATRAPAPAAAAGPAPSVRRAPVMAGSPAATGRTAP
jgi:Na+-translocating ferredoxin:NAD+ oxidoreductase RnfD subunit